MTPATSPENIIGRPDEPAPLRAPEARHHLMVLGAGESEVICAAGGLIYDWSQRGWDVTVHLPAPCENRSFRILGAKATPLTVPDCLCSDPRRPNAIIVSSLLCRQNWPVRHYFMEATLRNYAATAILGNDWPDGLGNEAGEVKHQLSPAARAFKRQAMIAAELVAAPLESVETFRGSVQRFRSHTSGDVTPA